MIFNGKDKENEENGWAENLKNKFLLSFVKTIFILNLVK